MLDNVTVASEWKENFRMSHPTFMELCEDLRPLLERKSTRMRRPISVYVPGVVVVCKRSGIRISFQCKRLQIRIL